MKRRAVYAGSFDPFTFGHLSVALSAARIFDEVLILVAVNADKACVFTPEERVEMIRASVKSFESLSVDSTEGYVVAYGGSNDFNFIVRGIRNETDAVMEIALAELNLAFAPGIQTVLIPANPTLSKVSSSSLKKRVEDRESITMYCPPEVAKALYAKFGKI